MDYDHSCNRRIEITPCTNHETHLSPPPQKKQNKTKNKNKQTNKQNDDSYRIYSIKRPGRLLNFWTLRVGAYSRWALTKFSASSKLILQQNNK